MKNPLSKFKNARALHRHLSDVFYESNKTIVEFNANFSHNDFKNPNPLNVEIAITLDGDVHYLNSLYEYVEKIKEWLNSKYDTVIYIDSDATRIIHEDSCFYDNYDYELTLHVYGVVFSGPYYDRMVEFALKEQERIKKAEDERRKKSLEAKMEKEEQERKLLTKLVKKYGIPDSNS